MKDLQVGRYESESESVDHSYANHSFIAFP